MPLRRIRTVLAISLHGLVSLLIAVALLGTVAGCQDQQITTTTRNLLRPGPMSLACVGRAGDSGVQTGLPLDHCPSPERHAAACDAGVCGSLFGIVANTA
ncbi:MAG: hypothetical protein KAI47_11485, partial [Deltaproteobacteria bacterium]|nr:hypothetical protein [Deltaproteobacteria bacterium]